MEVKSAVRKNPKKVSCNFSIYYSLIYSKVKLKLLNRQLETRCGCRSQAWKQELGRTGQGKARHNPDPTAGPSTAGTFPELRLHHSDGEPGRAACAAAQGAQHLLPLPPHGRLSPRPAGPHPHDAAPDAGQVSRPAASGHAAALPQSAPRRRQFSHRDGGRRSRSNAQREEFRRDCQQPHAPRPPEQPSDRRGPRNHDEPPRPVVRQPFRDAGTGSRPAAEPDGERLHYNLF